jgi:hypothetical protein
MANRLIVWNEETQLEVDSSFFNWGNVLPDSSDDKTFSIMNESEDYVAEGVTIRPSAIGDSGISAQILFTLDGLVYVDILSMGDIPPAGLSSLVTMRRVTRSDAVSGQFGVRVQAANWSVPDKDVQAAQLIDIEEVEG